MDKSAIKWIDVAQTLPLRQSVLWPHKSLAALRLPEDDNALHYGAFRGARLIAVASVFRAGDARQLRKFATDVQFQGQGVGARMLAKMIEYARLEGAHVFWCNARATAQAIYARAGLQPFGAPFVKEDIDYIPMRLRLNSSCARAAP